MRILPYWKRTIELPNKQGAKDGMNSKLNKTSIVFKKEKANCEKKRSNKLKGRNKIGYINYYTTCQWKFEDRNC